MTIDRLPLIQSYAPLQNAVATSQLPLSVGAPQTIALEPETFQLRLIANLTRKLLLPSRPPCLLRAPTGSGKTFVISRVIEDVCASRPTIWLWFVPFVNLVQQTEDALASNCPTLAPVMLSRGRNQDARAGMVLLSTAQGVGRAKDRNMQYAADDDDSTRSMNAFIARARAQGLNIGVVVDEAHIGLDTTTEFGRFVNWLNPEFLIMATATPNDERLTRFLAESGRAGLESFAASRDEVVAARLNKRYIDAVIYDIRESIRSVTDLRATVLRQAWGRSQRIKSMLKGDGVPLVPLLLVQVANGAETVEQAERELMQLCGVPPAVIAKHSSDDPDPVMMAAIANDTTKEVLIFKQSAGTGFDAPRAFVLASTKLVNDADFAMQFIGRVMRVPHQLRRRYAKPSHIPAELDTAYIYLADAEAQGGFEAAVQATTSVKSQLEGQTEKLVVRRTQSGALSYTNRPTSQPPMFFDGPTPTDIAYGAAPAMHTPEARSSGPAQQHLFEDSSAGTNLVQLDQIDRGSAPIASASASQPATRETLLQQLREKGIQAHPRRTDLRGLPAALLTEQRPELDSMASISQKVAADLHLSESLISKGVSVAFNRLIEKEVHTELVSGDRDEADVNIVMDRNALASEAAKALRVLSQIEDQDIRLIVKIIAERLTPAVSSEATRSGIHLDERTLRGLARDAAHWSIRSESQTLVESLQDAIAEHTTVQLAEPLPDVMLFPMTIGLLPSRKNIFAVMPPSSDDVVRQELVLVLDERLMMDDRVVTISETPIRLAKFDQALSLNGEERHFAEALDRADFVDWWHRNPDRKSYSVRIVRSDHQHYFYPDFVVGVSIGSSAAIRLIETKESTKDASRKSRREPKHYGKVLFITKDGGRYCLVNTDGSLGPVVNFDDLGSLKDALERSSKGEAKA
jgi:type III restriction enzyme